MSEITGIRCPKCGSTNVTTKLYGDGLWLSCQDCGRAGPVDRTALVQGQAPKGGEEPVA